MLEGNALPCVANLVRSGPLDIRSSLRCEGDDGSPGEEDSSCSLFRMRSGEQDRRFLGSGPTGDSNVLEGDMVS